MFHYFLVGVGSDNYTVVLQDMLEAGKENLSKFFDRVKYLKSVDEAKKDWHGNRRLGNGVIKACYFSGLFSPKRETPLAGVA